MPVNIVKSVTYKKYCNFKKSVQTEEDTYALIVGTVYKPFVSLLLYFAYLTNI